MALVGLAFLAGCGGGDPQYVEVEEVAESPQEEAMASDHTDHTGHDHGTATTSDVGFSYELPAEWVEKAPSSMVLLAIQTGNPPEQLADLSISAFPGQVGGQAANINRWRRQLGLPPLDPDAALALVKQIDISDMTAWQVELTGPADMSAGGQSAKMVVSAVFHDGKTWFFKLVGPASAVDGEVERYATFMDSVTF